MTGSCVYVAPLTDSNNGVAAFHHSTVPTAYGATCQIISVQILASLGIRNSNGMLFHYSYRDVQTFDSPQLTTLDKIEIRHLFSASRNHFDKKVLRQQKEKVFFNVLIDKTFNKQEKWVNTLESWPNCEESSNSASPLTSKELSLGPFPKEFLIFFVVSGVKLSTLLFVSIMF